MRRARRLSLWIVLFFGLLLAPARADVVVLRGGGRLTGTIESETPESVTIRMDGGSMSVSRDRIERIERESGGGAPDPGPNRSDPGEPAPGRGPAGEARASDAIEITQAIRDGTVSVEASGAGFAGIALRIRTSSPEGTSLYVAPGTYFSWKRVKTLGGAGVRQDMVATTGMNIRVSGETDAVIPAAGTDIAGSLPGGGDRFAIAGSPPSAALERLAGALSLSGEDALSKQVAVWIVTNDASYGDLWSFVKRTGGRDRHILDYAVVRGMQLCQEVGIHLKTKRIWRDSFHLVSVLEPAGKDTRLGALEPWVLEKLREMGFSGRTSEEVVTNAIATGTDINLIASACQTAGRGRYRSAAGPIKALLDRNLDPAVLKIATDALTKIAGGSGDPAIGGARRPVDACLTSLASESRSTRYRAVRTITGLSPRLHSAADRRRVVDALLPMLAREDETFVALLTGALVAYEDALIPSDLIPATGMSRVVVRRAGTTVLALLTHLTATNRLADLLQDVDEDVRRLAKAALAGRKDAVPKLRSLVWVPDPRLRRDLLDLVLLLSGPDVEKAMMEHLAVASVEDRKRIIDRYGEFGTPGAVAAVGRALNDPEAEVRLLAVATLAESRDPHAGMLLEVAYQRETDATVRKAIEAALR